MRTVIADPETGKTYAIEIDWRPEDDLVPVETCVRRWEWIDTAMVVVWVLIPVASLTCIGVVGYHVLRALFGEG